jgi:quercetin dioxygenase-like cupin family protein
MFIEIAADRLECSRSPPHPPLAEPAPGVGWNTVGDKAAEGEVLMAALETKSLDAPDETRPFEKGKAEIVTLGGMTVGRAVLEPGWRWSEHVKPIAGTSSCEVAHTGYVVSGRLRVVMDDGSQGEAGPGDAFVIPPGHDAWTVGDETFVSVDFSGGMADYAKQA